MENPPATRDPTLNILSVSAMGDPGSLDSISSARDVADTIGIRYTQDTNRGMRIAWNNKL